MTALRAILPESVDILVGLDDAIVEGVAAGATGWIAGLINAYPEGLYTYNEPPRDGYRTLFPALARWSGTSFATPLVAGLVAARMTTAGIGSRAALRQLVDEAGAGAVLGEVNRPGRRS